jgi:hypothetical protein
MILQEVLQKMRRVCSAGKVYVMSHCWLQYYRSTSSTFLRMVTSMSLKDTEIAEHFNSQLDDGSRIMRLLNISTRNLMIKSGSIMERFYGTSS